MKDIETFGYKVIEKLGESLHSEVFKVYKKNNPDDLLVLRRIKKTYAESPDMLNLIKRQTDALNKSNLPGTIIPKLFNPAKGILYLVCEYFNGLKLNAWRSSQGKADFKIIFDIFYFIADILNNIHQQGHIHGGIKPDNILINPDTFSIRIIDLVRIINFKKIINFINDKDFNTNTLLYISPEQMDMTSQNVIHTSDYYSLGVVFYEVLSGAPPFTSNDPLEIIKAHIESDPLPLQKKNSDIPQIICELIAKLMQKDPNKRYQTGSGLLHDLEICRNEYCETGKIGIFSLGKKDYPVGIKSSSIMVGRDKEKHILLKEYAKVCSGSFSFATISGEPGIGKTRLVKEFEASVETSNSYFASGKFVQFQKDMPYSTLIQAFKHLAKKFLSENREKIAYWKKTLHNALGKNGKLISDLIPEIESIIGQQPKLNHLSPAREKNRFNTTLKRFISCLAGQDHPFILFIDDLQWCDSATFDILINVVSNPNDYPFLFFIVAYRDNKIDVKHPLHNFLETLKKTGMPLKKIKLNQLTTHDANRMIADIMDTSISNTMPLKDVVVSIFEGNPLHISEGLLWLYHMNLIYSDQNGVWEWDSERIKNYHMPKTMLDLFEQKVMDLPENTLNTLRIASCIGVRFKAEDLCHITKKGLGLIYQELSPAIDQKILIKELLFLNFFHDSIHEAVYNTIDKNQKRDIHLQLSEFYIQSIPDNVISEKIDNIFTIVDHLTKGSGLITDKTILYRNAKLYFFAGKKSSHSLALKAANTYFKQSKALLPDDSWETEYQLTYLLFKSLSKSELIHGRLNNADSLIKIILGKANTAIDKAECLFDQTSGFSSLGMIDKSIKTANQGLAFFDKTIPEDNALALSKSEELLKKLHKDNPDIWQKILNMMPSNDRVINMLLTVYSEIVPTYYLSGNVPQLYLSAIQSVQNCLMGGMNESVLYAFVVIALYLQEQGNFDKAFKYENLVIKLAQRYPYTFGATRGMNGVVWVNAHNQKNHEEIIQLALDNIKQGKACGDLFNAGLSYGPLIWNTISQGADLNQAKEYAKECIVFSKKYNLSISLDLGEAALAVLSKEAYQKHTLFFSENEKIKKWSKDKHIASIGSYYVLRGISDYYLNEYQETRQLFKKAKKYLPGLTDNILNRLWFVFFVLTELKLCRYSNSKKDKDDLKAKIDPYIKKIKTWLNFGPILKPYDALITAEETNVNKGFKKAKESYLNAIDIARIHGYVLLEGHIHEAYGKHLLADKDKNALDHIQKAADLYAKCHAEHNLIHIWKNYPQYFTNNHNN